MWAQIAAAVVGAGLSYASAKKLQKEQYTDLRKSAERAGFNPLTVLRTSGGYSAVPHMSKYAAFGQALEGIFDAYQNRHVDKYNKAVQDLELKQKQADLKLSKAELEQMPLRGKLMKAQIADMLNQNKDDRVYLYERDGSPKLNPYGQHVYVTDAAAEAFPAMQAYVMGDGTTFSAPHEQLLDMGIGGYGAAMAAIAAGPKIEQSDASPTAFRYPRLIKQSDGNWKRPSIKTFPRNGTFWVQPKLSF
jgi:hypothetical protein